MFHIGDKCKCLRKSMLLRVFVPQGFSTAVFSAGSAPPHGRNSMWPQLCSRGNAAHANRRFLDSIIYVISRLLITKSKTINCTL